MPCGLLSLEILTLLVLTLSHRLASVEVEVFPRNYRILHPTVFSDDACKATSGEKLFNCSRYESAGHIPKLTDCDYGPDQCLENTPSLYTFNDTSFSCNYTGDKCHWLRFHFNKSIILSKVAIHYCCVGNHLLQLQNGGTDGNPKNIFTNISVLCNNSCQRQMQQVNLDPTRNFRITKLNMLQVNGTFHLSEVQFYVNEKIASSISGSFRTAVVSQATQATCPALPPKSMSGVLSGAIGGAVAVTVAVFIVILILVIVCRQKHPKATRVQERDRAATESETNHALHSADASTIKTETNCQCSLNCTYAVVQEVSIEKDAPSIPVHYRRKYRKSEEENLMETETNGEVQNHVYAVVQDRTFPASMQVPLQCEYDNVCMKTKDINERIPDPINVYETIRETVDCVGAEITGL